MCASNGVDHFPSNIFIFSNSKVGMVTVVYQKSFFFSPVSFDYMAGEWGDYGIFNENIGLSYMSQP